MAARLKCMSCSNLVGMMCFFLTIFFTCISSAARVNHLPGFDGPLPFHLETGYVTVDSESGSEYFYYYVESERNPSEDPLLLWLIGGPYCSGFVGLALNMGPLNIKGDAYNDTSITLRCNPYSWTKIASIIFLDWPVGAGFSFSRNAECYISDDSRSSNEIYKFLKEWLLLYPHFLSNPTYIGGDSYGGKLVPLVAEKIVRGNEGKNQQPVINIKGYLVGNGLTFERIDNNAQVSHALGLGLIPEELFELIVQSCEGEDYTLPESARCAASMKTYNEIISGINLGNTLAPDCPASADRRRFMIGKSSELVDPPTLIGQECNKDGGSLADIWGNNHLSWEALHIKKGTLKKWQYCREELNAKYKYNILNVAPHHLHLASKGYRPLVYSGDHDLIIPFVGTLKWIRYLNFSVTQGWRSWHTGGQVAGYTVLFSKAFTFATILGGSHTPADNRPIQSFSMFERWISHEIL